MKVLLIEDNAEIVTGITITFKLRWPEASVTTTEHGTEGISIAKAESPDIIILDINLPDISGFEVLRQIRLFSDVPVIILSVRSGEIDQLQGLDTGADDYILKPFRPSDLLARVTAVLRRKSGKVEVEDLPPLVVGNIVINFAKHEVSLSEQRLHLTVTEDNILFLLARNEGRLMTHDAIMNEVWGDEAAYIDSGALKRYIYQLRTKLGDKSDPPQLIVNERGMGYRLIKPQGAEK